MVPWPQSEFHAEACLAIGPVLLRFARGKIRGMGSKQISKCLKIFRRVTAPKDSRVVEIIALLDDDYCSRHSLATVGGLDLLVSKTFVNGNPQTSSTLMTWAAECFHLEIIQGVVKPDANSSGLGESINRSLLKRRVINYLSKKLPYSGQSGGNVLLEIFGSMAKFREHGLEAGSMQTLPWRASLPVHVQEAVDFCTRMVRGGGMEELWNGLLANDPLISAEMVLSSAPFKQTGCFDLPAALEAHAAGKDAETAPAKEEVEPTAPQEPPAASEIVAEEALPDDVRVDEDSGSRTWCL